MIDTSLASVFFDEGREFSKVAPSALALSITGATHKSSESSACFSTYGADLPLSSRGGRDPGSTELAKQVIDERRATVPLDLVGTAGHRRGGDRLVEALGRLPLHDAMHNDANTRSGNLTLGQRNQISQFFWVRTQHTDTGSAPITGESCHGTDRDRAWLFEINSQPQLSQWRRNI